MDDKRYAVLIDSDNISSKYISNILDEMTKYGVITYKRIYGDWTSPQAGKWKKELMENSITPIQQFRNTVGKNATDSTLIIDAMDILYTKNVDGFCIVSSDGDFTRLASRLRESGMEVIGMGENKTPRSFRAACSVFTDLELLQDQEDEEITAINNKQRPNRSHNIIRISKIENAIIEIIQENDNKGKQTDLGEIGSRLQKKYSDFDVRNYGYSSLSTFINEMDGFKTYKVNNKKKSLRRAKYIVNFDFDTEKLIQYSINRTAVIINVNNDMKIENIAFEGICINNINIEIPNEIEKYFDILTEKIDKTTLYVSLLNRKQELERIRTRIKDDNIHILDLIGYNGTIDQKELARIS